MSGVTIPALIAISNGDPGVLYAIVSEYGGAYAAGNDGSIWSCVRLGYGPRTLTSSWRKLAGSPMNGYLQVTILRSTGKYRPTPVHQLVLLAWHGPQPPGLLGRHLDGVKTNCRPGNLTWGTQSENMLDRGLHGDPTFCGNGHPQAILTDEIVTALRDAVRNGETVEAAAAALGVSENIDGAYCAVRGKTWRHLPGAVKVYKMSSSEDKALIRALSAAGKTLNQIMDETKFSYHKVYNTLYRNKT